MKRSIWISVIILQIIVASGCSCKHETIIDATCLDPSVCDECGEIFSEAKGHKYDIAETVESTCIEEGYNKYSCSRCKDEYSEELPKIAHKGEEKIVKKPTIREDGERKIDCEICGQIIIESLQSLGSTMDNPYEITAKKLYKEASNGKIEDYIGKYLIVTGKVVYISDYSDLKGYYLHGDLGEGVVCWVDGNKLVANEGSEVVFLGRLEYGTKDHVELTQCVLQNDVEVVEDPNKNPDSEHEETEITAEAEAVLRMIAEDLAKQVAKNPSTVKFKMFYWGFWRQGHTYAVQGTFECSNLMGVKEELIIKVVCEASEDYSKIYPKEVYLNGKLVS